MFLGMASYSETSSDDDEDDMAWFEERLKKKRHRMEDAGYLMGLRLELTKKSFKRDKSTSSSGESRTSAFMANSRLMVVHFSCDLINFWWFLDPLNREVVIEIAQRPIFSKGSSSVYISMKPSFHLQLKSGSPLPRYPEAVTSSTDEAFKDYYDLPVIFLAVALFCVHHCFNVLMRNTVGARWKLWSLYRTTDELNIQELLNNPCNPASSYAKDCSTIPSI
ncbi:hypothetical protein D5086_020506 [Populus alba]|uniref:Uncharacterized protein n=1 Tax=Populus alba TaxID=43335 RepID=A0ACC4BKV3_POPAL